MKRLLIIINSIALIGSLLWTYFQFDYEPVITSLVLLAGLIGLVISNRRGVKQVDKKIKEQKQDLKSNHINPKSAHSTKEDLEIRKQLTNVLFVDDDTKFKIIKILNKTGWKTKIVKDIENLDSDVVIKAHILFVDIHGVGMLLGFKDEGLGLAHSLKKKYPQKKVIIYSTESTGDRFHEALRSVDTFLSKNAEPFEFQELIEQYSAEVKLT